MPAGDAQRVWFPEMLEDLKITWSAAMTWEELGDFCHRMTQKRKAIRERLEIKPPRIRCPKCGQLSTSDTMGVSMRSALFALKSMGLVNQVELEQLDESWKRHRARNGLDAYGRPLESPRGGVSSPLLCVHTGLPPQ